MILKLILDRYEENIGVCLDFEDKRYLIPKEILSGVEVNDVFNIEFDGVTFHSPTVLVEETNERKAQISQRMKKLFKMCRDRRPPKI